MPLLLFLPLIFFKKNHLLVLIWDVLITLILLGTLWYHRYFESVPSIGSFLFANQLGAISDSLGIILKPWDILFFIDLPIIAYFMYFSRRMKHLFLPQEVKLKHNIAIVLIFLIGAMGLVYKDRNEYLPRFLNNIYNNKIVAQRYGILGAYYLDIYKNISSSLHKINPEKKATLLSEIKDLSYKPALNKLTGTAKGESVIIIQVESLASNVIGRTVEGQEITPNLNRFLEGSDYFENNYYAYGLGGTSDIDFSTNTSLYPMIESSVFVKYGGNLFTSLPRALAQEGYGAFAYHGYFGDFWNRFTAFNSMGFEKFYLADSYPKYDRINMGINDRDFLLKTADYIEDQKTPSYHFVVTLSSHTPFEVPEKERGLTFGGAGIPEYSQKYLQNINYTDRALGEFFKTLKEKNLFDNSLIVVYGDHLPRIESYTDDQGYAEYNADNGKKVPLFIKKPHQTAGNRIKTVAKNLDIMPTVLNLIGANTKFPMLGRDLYDGREGFFGSVLNYTNNFTLNDNYIYRDGIAPECLNRKDESKTELTNCSALKERLQKEQTISRDIVKYDLLKDFLNR